MPSDAPVLAGDRNPGEIPHEALGPGAVLLRHLVAPDARRALWQEIDAIAAAAPFRHWRTPGGRTMAVAMTACGRWGWTSGPSGYAYRASDPETGRPWPAMPARFATLAAGAASAAGFADFRPDSCLVNRYVAGNALSLHRDHDEQDRDAPIVSVSLGEAATFLWGGLDRADPVRRLAVADGDVVVWGGPSRLVYHGVARLPAGATLLGGAACRINLTFRSTGLPA